MTTVGQATGQWVPVVLTDGTVRHDWMPEPQPPSPDGTPGVWRLVPGAVDGYGDWTWFPAYVAPAVYVEPAQTQAYAGHAAAGYAVAAGYAAPPVEPVAPAPVASSPVAEPPGKKSVLQSKRALAVAGVVVVGLLLFLFTRGGNGTEQRVGTSTLSDSQKTSTLTVAANNYLAAMLAGNGAEAAKYLDPTVCANADKADLVQLATFLAKSAPGATGTVSGVEVNGDDGNVTGYNLPGAVPAEVRAAIEQGYTAGGDYSWHLRGDKWVFDSEC